ncbi:MAG: dipeptidase [Anaerolineales bacterium]
MIIVDGHLDLAYNAVVLGRDVRRPVAEIRAAERRNPPPGNYTGTCLASIPTLLEGEVAVIGGTLFVAPAWKSWKSEPQVYHNREQAHEQAQAQIDFYRRLEDEDERVRIVRALSDLDAVLRSWETDSPILGIFIVMEGAAPLRQPDEVGTWAEMGLRGVGPTWAAGTIYAGGNANPGPLTDAGRTLLHAMADLNLLLDLSHMWEEAAYEALDRYPGPVVASHANPRAFVDTPRQLPDPLIRVLAERGGLVGIVPFNPMLEPGWKKSEPRLPLNRVVEAIDYVCQLVGSAAHVGLGSDFDGGLGVESVPASLDSSADLGKIAGLLKERGYAAEDIEAILNRNWLRLMREALTVF